VTVTAYMYIHTL